MKKILALCLMTVLLCASASASHIPFYDTQLNEYVLTERCGAAVEENGDFSVSGVKAKAIETLFYGKIATYAAGGMLMFNVQLEGNFDTGVCYPVFRVVYAGSAPLNAETVMFNVDGAVYSMRGASSVTAQGRYRVETIKAYLTAEGFELVEALKKAEKAEITLLGGDQYTQIAEKAQFYASQKMEISAECLSAMSLPAGAPDFGAYALSELSKKAFSAKYAEDTKIEKVNAPFDCELALDDTFGLAADGAPGQTIKAVQDLLKENGFYVGTTAMQMNQDMIASVKAAQAYYGLDVTGYADAALIRALSKHAPMAENEEKETEIAYSNVSDSMSFNVDAWWLADRVETTVPGGGVSVTDRDNVLLIFDGEIASHALKSLSLSWEVKAEVVKDGKWVFPCSVYTEAQGGSVLSTTLAMLSEGRLIIVSEIPETVSQMEGEWVLKVSEGGNEFELNLSK